ncbi:hypothetical protein BaRGS_00000440 [Batillaria attramentaria]|uniref:Uncharacterized protein n=1 Tax=Batillaria attramentaria TaxID=370345 RepID=A0ABD0M9Y0_9CAEN
MAVQTSNSFQTGFTVKALNMIGAATVSYSDRQTISSPSPPPRGLTGTNCRNHVGSSLSSSSCPSRDELIVVMRCTKVSTCGARERAGEGTGEGGRGAKGR